jgi:hypothetical protein
VKLTAISQSTAERLIQLQEQLVTSALMPVRGAHWVSNRRKLGVGYGIVLETLEAATS